MTAINPVADFTIEDDVALVTIDFPPVNALGHQVRVGIHAGLEQAFADPQVRAVVLICGGRTFFAGADITEFGKPLASPVLREIAQLMERGPKPVIAAIHGTALGGGLETALACHWRIAVPSAKLGLPEVKLGLLAGAGGTQRLPRLVGAEMALEMVVSGDPIDARSALEHGLIDALAEGNLRAEAIAFARKIAADEAPLRRVRDMPPPEAAPALFQNFRATNAESLRGFEAPEASIQCIEAAARESFEEGMRIERALFEGLMPGVQCAAQRYNFFAEREAAKVPGLPKGLELLPLDEIGVYAEEATAAALGKFLESHGSRVVAPVGTGLVLGIGADVPQGEQVVPVRFAPTIAGARVMEIMKKPGMSDGALASALALAKRLGLASVVTLSGDRFIGQRMADRLAESVKQCVDDGLPIADLIATAEAFGLSIASFSDAPAGGRPHDGPAGEAVIERLIASLVNEGARILDEGAAARGSDIDIACVKSGMFKVYLGGPMFQASQFGLFRIIDTLIEHQQRWGDAYGPSPLLETVARHGGALHETKGIAHG